MLNQVTGETHVYTYFEEAQYTDCRGNTEEGVGYVRSVLPESPGLHARGNGRNNEMRLRKEKPIP